MKRLLQIIFFLFLSNACFAQIFGNEWINYSQKYYKFKIVQEGIYRIDKNELLQSIGSQIETIDPRNFQIFGREKQIPILVEGESDGVFDTEDFIEFYAAGNDGWLDQKLVGDSILVLHPQYSLINDTINYFITWNNSISNLRLQTESSVNYNDFDTLNWVWKKNTLSFNNVYYGGELDASGGSTSFYSLGEGWMGGRIGAGGVVDYSVPTTNAYLDFDAPNWNLRTVSAGVSNPNVAPNHGLQIFIGSDLINPLVDTSFTGYKATRFNFSLAPNQLGGLSTLVRHKVSSAFSASDDQAISLIEIKYAHTLNFENQSKFSLSIPHNTTETKSHLKFSNFPQNSLLYNLTSGTKIGLESEGSFLHALVSNNLNATENQLYLIKNEEIKYVTEVKSVNLEASFTNFLDYALLDSAFVIISENSLMASAETYRNYRQTTFNSVLVNVDELYNQFGGGIEKNGLAIRRFCDFILNNWNTPPQNLFLIGKGIREPDEYNSPGKRNNSTSFSTCLVPSIGYPASDNFFTQRLVGTDIEMAIPTGRISANNPQQVLDYLHKVQSFESQPPADWMKNILHFGGGAEIQEQTQFAIYLNSYKSIIEDISFGGYVTTILKNNSEPIQISAAEEIGSKIESGVSIMNFFSHAFGSGFDISIDDPSNFNWNGKYPLVIGNSCYNGDIYKPGALSSSENFVMIPDKGAIAFLGNSKLGYPGYLNIYTENIYKNISTLNYGKSIGSHMVKTIKEFQSISPNNGITIATCQQNTLHGDPALVINSFPKPDLAISESSIFFEPADINVLTDSMTVNLVITNIGKSTDNSFDVTFEHFLPSGQDTIYSFTVNGLLFKDTFSIKLPIDFLTSAGLHHFNVLVDSPNNTVEELDGFEFINNEVYQKELLISAGGIIPTYPYNYSIVGSSQLILKGSTANPFDINKNYVFQIDRTNLYNSSDFLQKIVNHPGGVVEWAVPETLIDSAVYFWRVAEVPLEGEYKWREFSFQYIAGQSGWGQASFEQYKESKFNQIIYNPAQSTFDFISGNIPLDVNVYGNQLNNFTEVKLNYEVVDYNGCQNIPSIHVVVIDPISLEPWGTRFVNADGTIENPNHNFGNANDGNACRNRVNKYFIFRQSQPNIDSLNVFLSGNDIPDGHYVLLYSWLYLTRDTWSAAMANTFTSMGATQLGNPMAIDSVPFIYFVKKGFPEIGVEILGESFNDSLFFNTNIVANGNSGFITSPKFGPSAKWKALFWKSTSNQQNISDSISLQIIGVKPNGVEQNISTPYTLPSGEQLNLENVIDAAIYPNIKLKAFLKDAINVTPLQFKSWQLLSDDIPEAALNPSDFFSFKSSQLQEGQEVKLAIAIKNISAVDMDSLLVNYWVQDAQNQKHILPYKRQDSLRVGEVLIDTISFSSLGYVGLNSLWIDVNPLNPTTNMADQLESYHFNNIAKINFEVSSDGINPILDVTFDGKHILDGEIVSAKPDIFIALKDENPYLLLSETADTSNFKLYITSPDGEQKRIYFSNQNAVEYSLASSSNNKFKINYKPILSVDGKYLLLIQATDKSGNASASTDYKINFEVINKSTITQVMNYPNPFTTRTQFVFTLTGSKVPDEFKIQILTVTGIVVKEISKQELGQLRVGSNITDYYWDGTDQFGDRLGNGIYFYRVITKIADEKIERRNSKADNYFTKEFGKMYLMR